MLNADKIQELKQKTNLIELLESYGHNVIKKGKSHFVNCPFHKEDTPSLSINITKNLWQCFGCKEAGDAIKLIQKLENLPFQDAVKKLAQKHGIPESDLIVFTPPKVKIKPKTKTAETAEPQPVIQPVSPPQPTPTVSKESQQLLTKVMGFYHNVFMSKEEGKAYLKSRGITKQETYEEYKIGYTDGILLKIIPNDSPMKDQLIELGILLETGKERFLHCVIFPLFNEQGDVVSFYGRHTQIEKGGHFYTPGPRQGLFNYPQLKTPPLKEKTTNQIIITESMMDAMAFIEKEIPNVLALYGTNGFTDDHLNVLNEIQPKQIILALDGDETGIKASAELKEKLQTELGQTELEAAPGGFSFNCQEIIFPEGLDANDYFQTHSKADFEALIPQTAKPGEPEQKVQYSGEPFIGKEKTAEKEKIDILSKNPTLMQKYPLKYADLKQGKLSVTIHAENPTNKKFLLDTFNLYSQRQRETLIEQASQLYSQKKEETEAEITQLITIAETKARQFKENPAAQEEPKADETKMTTEDEQEAMAFLKSPKLLDIVESDYTQIGYIGEEKNKKLAYLSMTSRRMKNPLSLVIMSSSAAGKSSLQKATLELCPQDESKHFTRLTQQSLFYLGQDSLKHKFLSIEEEEGSSEANYSLKTLLSAKSLTIISTTQDPQTGKKRADEYKTEGPVAVMVSTTSPELEAELASRTLIISVDESNQQTQSIHDRQKHSRTTEGQRQKMTRDQIIQKHQNAQRLLKPVTVVNNYAPQLDFPINRLKFRRSHEHYLDLIETIAFLRQYQKEIKTDQNLPEYIEVDKDDIRQANEIFIQIMGWTIDELSPPTRNLLKQIVGYCKERKNLLFTKREIRETYKWGYTHLYNHLKRLEELEYIIPVSGTNGTPHHYKLLYEGDGECTEKFIIGLKNPEDLA